MITEPSSSSSSLSRLRYARGVERELERDVQCEGDEEQQHRVRICGGASNIVLASLVCNHLARSG
jgi:hypothetical protein